MSDVPVGLRRPAGRLAFPPLQQRQVRLERPGVGEHRRVVYLQCVLDRRCGGGARRFDLALSLVSRRQPERAMEKGEAVGGRVLRYDCREIACGGFQVVLLIVGAAPEVLRPIQAFRKITLARQLEQMICRLQEMREVGGHPVNEAERGQQTGCIGMTAEPVFSQALIEGLDRPPDIAAHLQRNRRKQPGECAHVGVFDRCHCQSACGPGRACARRLPSSRPLAGVRVDFALQAQARLLAQGHLLQERLGARQTLGQVGSAAR